MTDDTKEKKSAKRIAFVISPIGEPQSPERRRANQLFNHVIKPILSEFGYETVRADKISKPGIITSQIINHIIDDSIVVADLTGHNPNVFYELAIRHAIKKPVIQLIQKGEGIPFDISIQRTIQIDLHDLDSVEEAKNELRKQIKAVEKDPTLTESPISVAVNFKSLIQSGDPQHKAIAELGERLRLNYLLVKTVLKKVNKLGKEQPAMPIITSTSLKGPSRIWIKLDETLPWIELRGKYENLEEAKEAVLKLVKTMQVRIVKTNSEKSEKKKKQ